MRYSKFAIVVTLLLQGCATRQPWGDFDRLDRLSDRTAVVVAGLSSNVDGLIELRPDSGSERLSTVSAVRFVEGSEAGRLHVTSTESGRMKWGEVRMKLGFWHIPSIGSDWVSVEPGKINYIGTLTLRVDAENYACFTIEDKFDYVIGQLRLHLPHVLAGREVVKRLATIDYKCRRQ